MSQDLCETTLTERFKNPNCKCNTYEGNLGPCKTFEEGQNGNCVYCDHNLECHNMLFISQGNYDIDDPAGVQGSKYRVQYFDNHELGWSEWRTLDVPIKEKHITCIQLTEYVTKEQYEEFMKKIS